MKNLRTWVKLREYMDKQIEFFVEKFVKNGWKMFHDEDSYRGYFSKEDKNGYTRLKFYLNREYPKGYWQNHVLYPESYYNRDRTFQYRVVFWCFIGIIILIFLSTF